jgi:hypothetical protein
MLLDQYIQLGYLTEPLAMLAARDAPAILGTFNYPQLAVMPAAAAGQYENACRYLADMDANLRQESVESALRGVQLQITGGNQLQGLQLVAGGIQTLDQRVATQCQTGLLQLEAGQTQKAAEAFRRAATDAQSPWRGYAMRYYQIITGQMLDAGAAPASGAASTTDAKR